MSNSVASTGTSPQQDPGWKFADDWKDYSTKRRAAAKANHEKMAAEAAAEAAAKKKGEAKKTWATEAHVNEILAHVERVSEAEGAVKEILAHVKDTNERVQKMEEVIKEMQQDLKEQKLLQRALAVILEERCIDIKTEIMTSLTAAGAETISPCEWLAPSLSGGAASGPASEAILSDQASDIP